jgi:hypothetical protein
VSRPRYSARSGLDGSALLRVRLPSGSTVVAKFVPNPLLDRDGETALSRAERAARLLNGE